MRSSLILSGILLLFFFVSNNMSNKPTGSLQSNQYPLCCYCCYVTSVVSDSVWPHRQQPTRLPRPWDFPGKNTGVGCHFLLQCMKVKKWKWRHSVVSDSATPWTAACQAPWSTGFSRQEYWSRVPLPSPSTHSTVCFIPAFWALHGWPVVH